MIYGCPSFGTLILGGLPLDPVTTVDNGIPARGQLSEQVRESTYCTPWLFSLHEWSTLKIVKFDLPLFCRELSAGIVGSIILARQTDCKKMVVDSLHQETKTGSAGPVSSCGR